MGKFHITKNGDVAPCRATIEECPLGVKHFDSYSKAEDYVRMENEERYGFLPTISRRESLSLKSSSKEEIIDLVKEVSGIRSKGFEYEVFASSTIAKRMGLEQMAIIDKEGEIVGVTEDSDERVMRTSLNKAIAGMKKYYEREGASIIDEGSLARVIYYSNNEEDSRVFVQSGGPNVLDSAIVEADKVVDIAEIKKLHSGGAQLPSQIINVDSHGKFSDEYLDNSEDYIRHALRDMTIKDAYGTNPILSFSEEKDSVLNNRLPLRHFVDTYKSKGAKTFLYTYENGDKIGEIDLNQPAEKVVDNMISKGISATLFLRANKDMRKATKEDLERFNESEKVYFKNGLVPEGDTFRLGQLNKNMISHSRGRIRIGGFLTNIRKEDFHGNRVVNKKDLYSFRLNISGDIKISDSN